MEIPDPSQIKKLLAESRANINAATKAIADAKRSMDAMDKVIKAMRGKK